MRSVIANRAIAVAVLLVAIAAAAGLAVSKHTVTLAAAAPQPQPHSAPVNTAVRACPAPGLAGAPGSQVALIAGPATTGAGRAVVSGIGVSTGAPLASVTQPGTVTVTGVHAVRAAAGGPASQRTARRRLPRPHRPRRRPARRWPPFPHRGAW